MKKIMLIAVMVFIAKVTCAATYEVQNGETFTVTDGMTVGEDVIHAYAGSKIKLEGENTDTFNLRAKLKIDGGEVELLTSSGITDVYIRNGLIGVNGGSLKVAEAKKIVFGSVEVPKSNDVEAINYSKLDCAISFTAEDAQGLVLTNRVTVKSLPDCPVSIADNAWLALFGENTLAKLNLVQDGVLTLDRWNLTILSTNALPNGTTVKVEDGRALAIKPCSESGDWNWAGTEGNVYLNTVLNGENAKLYSYAKVNLDIIGTISGIGDVNVAMKEDDMTKRPRTLLDGSCTFEGNLIVSGNNNGVMLKQATAGNAENTVRLTGVNSRIKFEGSDTVTIANLVGVETSSIYVNENQTYNIASLSGEIKIDGDGITKGAVVNIADVSDNATVNATGAAYLKVNGLGENVMFGARLEEDFFDLVMDFTECVTTHTPGFLIDEDIVLTIKGNIPVEMCDGVDSINKTIIIDEDSNVSSLRVAPNTNVKINGRAALYGTSDGSWKRKVLNWFDASDTETLIAYDINREEEETIVYTNGFPVIKAWADRRTGKTGKYLYNGRSYASNATDEHQETYPYVVTNGLNGMNYVSFGSCGKGIPSPWVDGSSKSGTERRRLFFYQGSDTIHKTDPEDKNCINAKHIIMVFGSQQGGGYALVSSKDSSFSRNSSSLSAPFCIKKDYGFKVDGEQVDATVATPNGGWQIVAIDCSNCEELPLINGLGMAKVYNDAGGQNYAEVIFFEEELTAKEVYDCEIYLANKWGLEGSYHKNDSYEIPVNVNVNGNGVLDVKTDATLAGGFHGTVSVETGKTLSLSDALPPTENLVPSNGRIAWFDPNLTDSIYRDSTKLPDMIRAVYNRNEDGVDVSDGAYYLYGTGSDGVVHDRRPQLKETALSNGRITHWIDFLRYDEGLTEENKGSYGNLLRSRIKGKTYESNGAEAIANVVQAIMVVDSSRGGGNLMHDKTNFHDGPPGVRADKGTNYMASIWSNRRGAFANITMHLDDRLVDDDSGFNERPEVVSVSFDETAYSPMIFGYYDAGNTELFGEMLFYSRKLSDEERTNINAYLAHKWFGEVKPGYSDLSLMTVSGSGKLYIPEGVEMPKIASDFTGTVKREGWYPGTVIIIR